MDAQSLVEVGGILVLVAWNGYRHIRDKRENKRQREFERSVGLAPNPTRCEEHAEAINEIRGDVKRIKEYLDIV